MESLCALRRRATCSRFILRFPKTVLIDGLDSFIASFDGDLLPEFERLIVFDTLETAPEGAAPLSTRLGGGPAMCLPEGETWRVHAALPIGPARPDTLAIRVVIPVIFAALAAEGVIPIHSAAVLIQDRLALIAGPSGSGKSTCADELVRRGADFFADDRVLAWTEAGCLVATPSFERPNPFARWVGHEPERGRRPPPRRTPPHGRRAAVGRLLFPTVKAGEPSTAAPVTP